MHIYCQTVVVNKMYSLTRNTEQLTYIFRHIPCDVRTFSCNFCHGRSVTEIWVKDETKEMNPEAKIQSRVRLPRACQVGGVGKYISGVGVRLNATCGPRLLRLW